MRSDERSTIQTPPVLQCADGRPQDVPQPPGCTPHYETLPTNSQDAQLKRFPSFGRGTVGISADSWGDDEFFGMPDMVPERDLLLETNIDPIFGPHRELRNGKRGRRRDTPTPEVFARHPWLLSFVDPTVEAEFLVFHVMSHRFPSIAYCIGATLICAFSLSIYGGLSHAIVALYGVVTLLLAACTVLFYLNIREQSRLDAQPCAVQKPPHTVQASTSPPPGPFPVNDSFVGGLLASTTAASGDAPHSYASTTLLGDDRQRRPYRRNAINHEVVCTAVLIINFLVAVLVFAGKGDCSNPRWDYEDELKGCRRAIQIDSIPLLMFITASYATPVRSVRFAFIYVVFSIANLASRAAPNMIHLIPAYFWSSVTVYGTEALVCIGSLYLREKAARAQFEVHVQQHQRAAEVAEIRRRTERMVAAQIPLAAARCVASRPATSLETREALLYCWSPGAVIGVVTIHNFAAWSARRGSSDIVECLRRMTGTFDALQSVFTAAPPKYPSFGDAYVLLETPPAGDAAAAGEGRGPSDAGAALAREMLTFCLACVAQGSLLLSRIVGSAASVAEDQRVPKLELRATVDVGVGGGVVNRITRNHLATGPIVLNAMRQVQEEVADERCAVLPHQSSRRTSSSSVAVGCGSVRIRGTVASSLDLNPALTSRRVRYDEIVVTACFRDDRSMLQRFVGGAPRRTGEHNPLTLHRLESPSTTNSTSACDSTLHGPTAPGTPRHYEYVWLHTIADPPMARMPRAIDEQLDCTNAARTPAQLRCPLDTMVEHRRQSSPIGTRSVQTSSAGDSTWTHTAVHDPEGSDVGRFVMTVVNQVSSSTASDIPAVASKRNKEPREPALTSRSTTSVDQRVEMRRDYLFYHFVDPRMEAAFQQNGAKVTTDDVQWGVASFLMSVMSLVVICFIDDVREMAPGMPLMWALVGALLSVAGLVYLIAMQRVEKVWPWALLSIVVQSCFLTSIGVAPVKTIIGDSQLIWPTVQQNANFIRPRWWPWYVMWVQDVVVVVLFFLRTYFLFDIPLPSSMYTVTLFVEGTLVLHALAYRVLTDYGLRCYFAAAQHLELLKEELAEDYKRLHTALEATIPEGIAGRLVSKARQRSAVVTVRKRLHPIRSTSFGTSTDETPFVVVELEAAAGADSDGAANPLVGVKAVMDMATSLTALCKRGFEERVQFMKASHSTLLFCARATTGSGREERAIPDEERASDMLSFAVRAARILQAGQRGPEREEEAAAAAVRFRIVVGSGYLMGAVVGRVGVTFDYYGSAMSRALTLLTMLEWGSVAATSRLVSLHRLDRAHLSTSALLSDEEYVAAHVGFTPFRFRLIQRQVL